MLITANIFQPLIDVFEAVLKFFHNSVGVPWGWSIVLLTVVIRALLVPLTLRQFHSMQRLQQHGPELKKLQARYKEDKQRQQQEMMKFYKENNINPFGACLPLVAQLPVFISLFYMLRTSLRVDICPEVQRAAQHLAANAPISHSHLVPCKGADGSGFLFIHDLTNKATGATLVVLILLYVGTQLASSLMMSSPTMDKSQRNLMLVMPLFFVIFIIGFPAGVIVYWVTTNAWTILQQYVVRKRVGPIGPPPAEEADAGPEEPGGTGGGRGGRALPPGGGKPEAVRGNGAAGMAGGLGALLRGRVKPQEAVAAQSTSRGGPPPRPPRKKKKRSGRRR